ncbi:ATP-dependent DNA ligase [compost metagenome]
MASLDLDRVLLDGEVAALDANGRTDFGLLQRKLDEGDDGLTFFVFDLLAEGGRNLRRMPLADRKAKLRQLLRRAPRRGPR